MMKTFDLPIVNGGELVESQLIEMPAENFVIATNSVDRIAVGGVDKQVIVYNFELQPTDDNKSVAKIVGDPYIGLVFNSAVRGIEFFGAN